MVEPRYICRRRRSHYRGQTRRSWAEPVPAEPPRAPPIPSPPMIRAEPEPPRRGCSLTSVGGTHFLATLPLAADFPVPTKADSRRTLRLLSWILTARPFEPATARSYRAELAAIRTCFVATLKGKSRCCCLLLPRRDGTRWYGVELSERSRIDCCFYDRRVHRQLGHRQAALVR